MRFPVMSSLAIGLGVLSISLVSACETSTTSPDDGGTKAPQANTVVDSADALTITTPDFEVPPGDSFTCFYMDYDTAAELDIVGATGIQGNGGHHIVAYFASDPRPVGFHACKDEEMVNLNQIAGSAGDSGQVINVPEGLALKVPAGKQIVVQAHYINTTGATETLHDTVKLVKGDPSKIKAFMNYFVTDDEGFEIPAAAPLARTTECTLDRDYQMAITLPHMHELGQHFTLEIVPGDGSATTKLIDTDWQPQFASHPPVQSFTMDKPLLLKKGDKLRQTCTWNNSTTDPVTFPREMCLSFFYYWPGESDINCDMKPVTP